MHNRGVYVGVCVVVLVCQCVTDKGPWLLHDEKDAEIYYPLSLLKLHIQKSICFSPILSTEKNRPVLRVCVS